MKRRAGATLAAIADDLERDHVPTGQRWPATVKAVLSSAEATAA